MCFTQKKAAVIILINKLLNEINKKRNGKSSTRENENENSV